MPIVHMRLLLWFAMLAATTPAPGQLAVRALEETARVCEPDGMLLWRKSLCGPIVLVDPATRAATANRPDPGGGFQKQGDVFVGAFPRQFTPANTAIQWGGQEWATVTLPLPTDPFQRLKLLVHESFHRIQGELGLHASDAPNAHLD